MILETTLFEPWAAMAESPGPTDTGHSSPRWEAPGSRGVLFSFSGASVISREGNSWAAQMLDALRRHGPEYLMEAAGLGIFMVSASLFATLPEFPGSPVHQTIPDAFLRRILMGMAMGLTAIGIIYSPWGKQSGAHVNPASFLRAAP